jgi:PAS domain S-box-containing protein
MTIPAWQNHDRGRLFDDVPSGIAVLGHSLTVVDHNRAFSEIFGEARGQPCYSATKGKRTPCTNCPALAVFADGGQRVVEQQGTDQHGRDVYYLARVVPIRGNGNDTEYVAAITTDLTDTKRLQQEYQTLFEKVPCFVAVINRSHRVVNANESFRRMFGEPTGEPCYRLYKRRHEPCPECPVDRTFTDRGHHSSQQIGVSREGRSTPYLVFTAPLLQDDGEVTHVIEMALDMTEHQDLREQLSRANVMRLALVDSSPDAIMVFDENERFLLLNQAAESLLGYSRDQLIGHRAWQGLLPGEVRRLVSGRRQRLLHLEATLTTAQEEQVPVRATGVTLRLDRTFIGSAVFVQDLRQIKKLEREKLDAERLAAVGETVAGLAHGIKNILTGLQGGMYVASLGMRRSDVSRIKEGWDMITRNMGRISELTRSLLAFSRGEPFECTKVRPADLVRDVVALYHDGAAQHHIDLRAEIDQEVAPACMDAEGMHGCLTNLISNAVDACLMTDQPDCSIVVRLFEENETVVFEVIDSGCGMDYEVKQKAFTSFFTTKAKGGTGLGLLLTRKLVQQHGGSIRFVSEPGQGTTFRLSFPRSRLPRPDQKRLRSNNEGDNDGVR